MARPPTQAVTTVPQWLRCAHSGTSLVVGPEARGLGVITLAAAPAMSDVSDVDDAGGGAAVPPAGLAVGADGWVYHAVPEQGRITRTRGPADGEDLLETAAPTGDGDFHPRAAPAAGPIRAVALAFAGRADRLVALDADGWLFEIDLAERRVTRRLRIGPSAVAGAGSSSWIVPMAPDPATAVDLAEFVDGVLVAAASRAHPLWLVRWHVDPVEVPVPPSTLDSLPAAAVPTRVAADEAGRIWLLWRAPGQPAWATPVVDERTTAACGPLPSASDVELDGGGGLVVAGAPGADLRVFRFADGARTEDRPLRARRADGRGLVRTPDGRIGHWTPAGLRTAYGAPITYSPQGTVITYALDSGTFRQRWGRLFVDACLPPGTGLTLAAYTADDLPGDEADPQWPGLGEPLSIPATPPANAPDRPDLAPGPPLPAVTARFFPAGPVHRRGPLDQPWTRREADDPFLTFEAPVNAGPGRYLWLRLELTGTAKLTPRLRAVRVETSGARLLEKLPQVFTEDHAAAAFLDRYLELLYGPLADLGYAADARHVLLDPRGAPPELLPWLASLVGLVLDERWSESARRTMLAEAVCLFRRRGTVGALLRMLEIVLGVRPVLVERFRFRGLDGGGVQRAGSSFAEYAHRFSVVVPGALSARQLDLVHDLLAVHRPAHTLVEVCSAGTGSRIGVGLHLQLTSVIGRSAGFTPVAVGGVLGRGGVLGPVSPSNRPAGGVGVGHGGVGRDAWVAS